MSGDPKPGVDDQNDEQNKNEGSLRTDLNGAQVKLQNTLLGLIEELRQKTKKEKGVDVDVVKDILTPWKNGEASDFEDDKDPKKFDSRVLNDLIKDYSMWDQEAKRWSEGMGENIKDAIQKLGINPSAAALLSYTSLIEKPKSTGIIQLTLKRIVHNLKESALKTDLGDKADEAGDAFVIESTPPAPGGIPEDDWKQAVADIYTEMINFLDAGSGPEEVYGYSAGSYVENTTAKVTIAKEVLFGENELRSTIKVRIVRGIFQEEWDKITTATKPVPPKSDPKPAPGASPDASKGVGGKLEFLTYEDFKPLWRKADDKSIFVRSHIKGLGVKEYRSPMPIPDTLNGKGEKDPEVNAFLEDCKPALKAVHDSSQYNVVVPKTGTKEIQVVCTENPLQKRETFTILLEGALPDWLVKTIAKRGPELDAMRNSTNEMDVYRWEARIHFMDVIKFEAKCYRLHELCKELPELKKYTFPDYKQWNIQIPEDYSEPESGPDDDPEPTKPGPKPGPKPTSGGASTGRPARDAKPARESKGERPERSKFSDLPKWFRELFRNRDEIEFDLSNTPERNKDGKVVIKSELVKKETSTVATMIATRLWDAMESIITTRFKTIAKAKDTDAFLSCKSLKTDLTYKQVKEATREKYYKEVLAGKDWDEESLKLVVNDVMAELWAPLTKKVGSSTDAENLLTNADHLMADLERYYMENLEEKEKSKDGDKGKGKSDKKEDGKKSGGAKEDSSDDEGDEAKKAAAHAESVKETLSYLSPDETVLIQIGEGATSRVEERSFRKISEDAKTVEVYRDDPVTGGRRVANVVEKPFRLMNRELKKNQRILWQDNAGIVSDEWVIHEVDDDEKTAILRGIGKNTGKDNIPNVPYVALRRLYPSPDMDTKQMAHIWNGKTWETHWQVVGGLVNNDSASGTNQDYLILRKPNEEDWEILESTVALWNPLPWVKETTPEGMTEFETSITNPQDKAYIAVINQWIADKKPPAEQAYAWRKQAHEKVRQWISGAEPRPR